MEQHALPVIATPEKRLALHDHEARQLHLANPGPVLRANAVRIVQGICQ